MRIDIWLPSDFLKSDFYIREFISPAKSARREGKVGWSCSALRAPGKKVSKSSPVISKVGRLGVNIYCETYIGDVWL